MVNVDNRKPEDDLLSLGHLASILQWYCVYWTDEGKMKCILNDMELLLSLFYPQQIHVA
jgi:hypothetical protein